MHSIKAVSWRLLGTFATVGTVYIYTGEVVLVAEVGAFELFSKICIFYAHERMWARIPWELTTQTAIAEPVLEVQADA
jgi:sulfate adenylyltransferase subunit 1